MKRELRFSPNAIKQLEEIGINPELMGVLKQIRKTLGYLETDLKAKSLQTHEFESLTRRYKRKVFEVYVQQNTPGAYRIFWYYCEDETGKNGERIPVVTVVAIVSHPK